MIPKELSFTGLAAVREQVPMVHHITNSVVTNFTANVTLCLGAAPVMAPCIDESAEMVRYAGALLLNIGTLDPRQVKSMLAAGKAAEELGIPIILDPVGAGATTLRTETAAELFRELVITTVRANAGEILALAGSSGKVRGVDSMDTVEGREEALASFAARTNTVIAVTGETDVVTDGERTVAIDNGHPLMGRVTGTGCAATTAVACLTACSKDPFAAAAEALAVMGCAGETAAERAKGPGTFVPEFLDSLAGMNENVLNEMARVRSIG
ncbi:MAG: hydroxyethylthiazole kinase [Candidatus Aegiribacteria sp.]|nr:hydroxyethylthiazole kinase [Candidatus Aegiribacteria sp.]MBD3295695.1 hydroxyethylthiazole kinase [Candidatus Fermentibacteria bacterium]